MTNLTTNAHLDLIEKCLCFSLWPEPLKPLSATAKTGLLINALRSADKFIARYGIRFAIVPKHSASEGVEWPSVAHTMIGQKRLRNIRELCGMVESDGIPGNWVECGVWRGGASIMARKCLNESRTVICCDSFQGLPIDPKEPLWSTYDFLRVSQDEVENNFKAYEALQNVQFIKGWFCDTLHTITEPIAILRADGDSFDSTLTILARLYDKVSVGGYVIIDDYWLPLCRAAVTQFCASRKIQPDMHDIDGSGVYWRKGCAEYENTIRMESIHPQTTGLRGQRDVGSRVGGGHRRDLERRI